MFAQFLSVFDHHISLRVLSKKHLLLLQQGFATHSWHPRVDVSLILKWTPFLCTGTSMRHYSEAFRVLGEQHGQTVLVHHFAGQMGSFDRRASGFCPRELGVNRLLWVYWNILCRCTFTIWRISWVFIWGAKRGKLVFFVIIQRRGIAVF